MIFGSGLSGLRMGVRDPEIDCEGCLLGLWWIDGDGCGMCGDCVINMIMVLSKFEHWVINRTIMWVYYDWKITLFEDYLCPTVHS